MPTIQIRDVPKEIYKELAADAKRERRSITQQALVILERGLHREVDNVKRRQELLERGKAFLAGIKLPLDPVKLIREDRNR